jgi:hypothetical protein
MNNALHIDAIYNFKLTIHLLNSRTVKVFASCRTAVLRLVIFTLTLAQKFEISNLKLSLINSISLIQNVTYTKWLNKKKKDMRYKIRLLTAREKRGIVHYCLKRR